jgi:hypothetical protein
MPAKDFRTGAIYATAGQARLSLAHTDIAMVEPELPGTHRRSLVMYTRNEQDRKRVLEFLSRQPGVCKAANKPGEATEVLKMMAFDLLIFSPWLALIAGVSILVVPRLLNYIVAVYLILIGIIGLAAQL